MTEDTITVVELGLYDSTYSIEILGKDKEAYFIVNFHLGSFIHTDLTSIHIIRGFIRSVEIIKLSTNQKFVTNDLSITDTIYSFILSLKERSFYNLMFYSVEEFVNVWGFKETEITVIEEAWVDCECCGSYVDIEYKLANSRTSTSVGFYEDGHFGYNYLPTEYDLLNFIINGECDTEY